MAEGSPQSASSHLLEHSTYFSGKTNEIQLYYVLEMSFGYFAKGRVSRCSRILSTRDLHLRLSTIVPLLEQIAARLDSLESHVSIEFAKAVCGRNDGGVDGGSDYREARVVFERAGGASEYQKRPRLVESVAGEREGLPGTPHHSAGAHIHLTVG